MQCASSSQEFPGAAVTHGHTLGGLNSHSLPVLEPEVRDPGVRITELPPGAPGRLLPASSSFGGLQASLGCGHIPPSLPPSSLGPSPLCLSVSNLPLLSLLRTPILGSGAHPKSRMIRSRDPSLTYAKTLLPNSHVRRFRKHTAIPVTELQLKPHRSLCTGLSG